jgi:thiol-disulfide isomerase/thioredoxin
MKKKLVCIAIIIFASNVLFAQKQNIYKILNKYNACDTASFVKTWYTKGSEKLIIGDLTYAMTLCRKAKGAKWHAYDIHAMETTLLDLSYFNSKQRKIYLADSNNLYQVVNTYEFDTYMAPPYIWDIRYFPWDQRFKLTNFYKRIKQTNEFVVYRSKLGDNKTFLYVNTKNELIERIVDIQADGSYDSVIFHYNYFKNPTTEYISKTPDHPYFPVNNKNDSIALAKKKREIEQKVWNDRIIIKDSVLSKIINGKFDYYLIDFWHLSCHPCKVNLRILDTALKQLKNVEVVLINVHDNDEEANTYLTKYGLPFRNICDYDHSIEGYFKPQFYPTIILLDNSGKVVYRYDGMETDIGNKIKSVLASEK